MDSLTQIVLGAACGEIALGKKIGNKALLFGAIGGTIPDLDVFVGNWLFGNEIDAMSFHRGFMHSIIFAVFGSFFFGWITFRLYNQKKRKGTTTLKQWIGLYFLAIFTHPILDSFTPYGTQLFAPFTDYRVAFSTIAVIDPLYTLPFLVCIIGTMFYKRNNPKRRRWTTTGIWLSSIYLLCTIANKFYINSVFENSFTEANISYQRFATQPTILNTILWYGIAENNSDYKVGFYSLLDSQPKIDTILTIPKNHSLIDIEHKDIQKLIWFSNGYYNLVPIPSSASIAYVDLRYPLLNPTNTGTSLFRFALEKNGERWDMNPFSGQRPKKSDIEAFLQRFYGK